MMSRFAAISIAVLLIEPVAVGARTSGHSPVGDLLRIQPSRKISCKTPSNAATCYWTHGRLRAYNGTPAFRLWKIGTRRLLGIYSGPGNMPALDNENPEFPPDVQRLLRPFDNQIFADFEVCPLEPEYPGKIQAACIESAKHMVVDVFENH
jgi:hypothetical protein